MILYPFCSVIMLLTALSDLIGKSKARHKTRHEARREAADPVAAVRANNEHALARRKALEDWPELRHATGAVGPASQARGRDEGHVDGARSHLVRLDVAAAVEDRVDASRRRAVQGFEAANQQPATALEFLMEA